MDMKRFLKPTRVKIFYLAIAGIMILVSGILSANMIYCFKAPCPQKISTLISQKIYSIVSFNLEYISPGFSYINTGFALAIKNLFNPVFSAGAVYLVLSLIIGLVIHYLIICCILHFLNGKSSPNDRLH